MRFRWTTTLALVCVLLLAAAARGDEKDMSAPEPGTMRFSTKPDDFPRQEQQTFSDEDPIYALVGFGGPWADRMKRATDSTSTVVKLFVGDEEKAYHAFYPGQASFAQEVFVLDVAPDPEHATQFTYNVTRALGELEPGTHQLTIKLWSFDANTEDRFLASGNFTFELGEGGRDRLRKRAEAIEEAKHNRDRPQTKPEEEGTEVLVRHEGSDLLRLRGDEIVVEGAVVGRFDGQHVRKAGSIVGEIRGDVYRHEGANAWSLDQGNLYPGVEIRWQGAIIGDVREDGSIYWEGSPWGTIRPYEGTHAEVMRVMAAVYYWSEFFRRK